MVKWRTTGKAVKEGLQQCPEFPLSLRFSPSVLAIPGPSECLLEVVETGPDRGAGARGAMEQGVTLSF